MSAQQPAGRIIVGDARTQLAALADDSVDMVLSSPPYFGLRDYDVAGQIGQERHVDEWVDELGVVLGGLQRVLRPTGTLWLNLGDSYSLHPRQGAARKSLLLAPERVAGLLVDHGWLLRNKIVWAKPNPMPTSVRDRLNCTWEYLYVFAQQPRYYFNLDAVRQPHQSAPPARTRLARQRAQERWRGPNADTASGLDRLRAAGLAGHRRGKNPGDVWTIANPGYRAGGDHHAVFPLELARRAIQAGCPPGGVVLDPFLGAGTTAVASEALDRQWLGIELNPRFAALATKRLQQARASPAA